MHISVLISKVCFKLFFILFYFYLFFIFGCFWVFIAACGLFSGCDEQGLPPVVVCRLLIAVASLVVEHGL